MTNKEFRKKLRELIVGKRTLKERLLTALFPALLLSFLLFFFGPLDLTGSAEDFVNYTVIEILPTCLKVWGAAFAAMFLLTWLPGGKIHVWLSSLLTGLALAFYIQGNWLNIDLGTLDGSVVEWQLYGDNALINLAVFALITLIPFLIHFFSRKLWKNFVVFVSVLLLLMQSVPLAGMLIGEYRERARQDVRYILSTENEYTLGQENIVVFLLDQTDPEHIALTLEKYPDLLAPFQDFTCFDNFNTEYIGTFPAAAYLLTHEPYSVEETPDEYFEKAWHSADAELFYGQMREEGWTVRLFNSARHVAGDLVNEYGKISNVVRMEGTPEYTVNRSVFRKLIKLVFYRYFPLIMKAPYRIYTEDLSNMLTLSSDENGWDQNASIQRYLEKRLTVEDTGRVYVTYHFTGAHAPLVLNEHGQISTHAVNFDDQLAGQFYMISEYLQQMKDYHIYDSSTVIITADHGTFEYPHSIFYIKSARQRQDAMNISHAPVSQSDFMATIAEAARLEDGQFGRSVFEVPENEERLRCVMRRWLDPELPKVPRKASNAVMEYCYVGDEDTLLRMIADGEFTSYAVADPYY